MSGREAHWRALTDAGLMHAPPEQAATAPWFIRALQGFGAWVASIFLFAAVLALLGWNDERVPLGLVGVAALVGAFFIVRETDQDFLYQASLALSMAGQLFITIALEPFGDVMGAALGVAAVAAVLVAVMQDFAHRFIATLVLCGALVVALVEARAGEFAAPLFAAPFAVLWANETRWLARRPVAEPLALGLGFGLLIVSLVTLRFSVLGGTGGDDIANAIRVFVLLASLGYVLHAVLEDSGVRGARHHGALAISIAAALALELAVTNASLALLVLVAAIRAQRPALAVTALATLLALVSYRYYTLQLTLLVKSLWLMGAGVVLLALFGVARRWWGFPAHDRAARRRPGQAALGAMASVAVCLLFAGIEVAGSESVLANGRVMVLQLAPVDPRSIIQGDYMRLGFGIEGEVRRRLREVERRRGWVVLAEDENGVAQFVRMVAERPGAEAGSFAIPYRWRRGSLTMLTDAFFFQEGTAQDYAQARFGAFRVGDGGEVLLEQLLDEDKAPLGTQY